MLFFSAVSPQALELLNEVQSFPVLNDFYLVRGTALALGYGHRISIDLDFFTAKEFETNMLIDFFKEKYSIAILSQAKNSLTIDIRSVKIDFIRHNYPLIKPIQEVDGIRMASVEDIAAMKLNSTMNRGSKKERAAPDNGSPLLCGSIPVGVGEAAKLFVLPCNTLLVFWKTPLCLP